MLNPPRTTRHEKRLLSATPLPPTERTSLKQFQDQLEQAHQKEAMARVQAHHHHLHSQSTVQHKLAKLSLGGTGQVNVGADAATPLADSYHLMEQTDNNAEVVDDDDEDPRPLRVSQDPETPYTER
ncbi:BQ5605_C019g08945 [Microbotryum silenes-dioicae]|uniref:BQ5605_C019g08945 protein n=1 Tax=Microbotryum silenes-dioicae TaxID=796604 RepID=A0A2X0M054_9BASI|nr:BQ5605_C019g08945 [Microbotryum silenes-dioicae]